MTCYVIKCYIVGSPIYYYSPFRPSILSPIFSESYSCSLPWIIFTPVPITHWWVFGFLGFCSLHFAFRLIMSWVVEVLAGTRFWAVRDVESGKKKKNSFFFVCLIMAAADWEYRKEKKKGISGVCAVFGGSTHVTVGAVCPWVILPSTKLEKRWWTQSFRALQWSEVWVPFSF